MMTHIIMIAAGLVSGIIAGMGIGGGSLLIPILAIFTSLSQQDVQGINLIVFIPASLCALIIHKKNNSIDTSLSRPIIISGLIGAAAGSFLALHLNSFLLRKFFAVFIFIIGIFQLFKKNSAK